jgi:amino acid permease
MTEGEGISTISCVCVCVNMMIGAGFLALPQGFLNGGIISSICKLIHHTLLHYTFISEHSMISNGEMLLMQDLTMIILLTLHYTLY